MEYFYKMEFDERIVLGGLFQRIFRFLLEKTRQD